MILPPRSADLFRFIVLGVLSSPTGCQDGGPKDVLCAEAEERIGHRVCVQRIPDDDTWQAITFAAAPVDQLRATTYLVPARKDSRLAPLFVDANAFAKPEESLHYKFLTESFPEFATLEYAEYVELVDEPDRREWFSGGLTEYVIEGDETRFGFYVSDPQVDAATTITCEQFREVYGVIAARVEAGTVVAIPTTDWQRDVLADCDVPSYDPSATLDSEPYTKASGCGTVRRYTLAELPGAQIRAEFGWQDVLVLEEAPIDIETVVSGVVTGTRQGELSHVNVRSAARGTPNCYVRDAYDLLARWDGRLVRLTCTTAQATIEPITPEEAATCWEAIRPDPVEVTPPDLDTPDLVGLLDLPTQTPEERLLGLSRYGAKGTNLATLYQRIDPELELDGFLIPFHAYAAFMQAGTWSVDLGAGPETLSFVDTISRYLADPTFRTDGAVRRQRLTALQEAIKTAPCDAELVAAIADELLAVFGSDRVMVRFRSSSNAEDGLVFNGAGLYDSTSACLADETDADALGPSMCDADEPNERGLCRALTKVWASLWGMKAYEERDWYGIDQAQIVMGILVDTRTKGELANIVAFSGNPLVRGDDRYLVNAQLGELDVVAAVPGVWPEKDLLTLENGTVIAIERARGSTELPEGKWVLDDARLGELGARLAEIVAVYPLDIEPAPGQTILLDTEWKLRSDGRLAIKQIRPFPG